MLILRGRVRSYARIYVDLPSLIEADSEIVLPPLSVILIAPAELGRDALAEQCIVVRLFYETSSAANSESWQQADLRDFAVHRLYHCREFVNCQRLLVFGAAPPSPYQSHHCPLFIRNDTAELCFAAPPPAKVLPVRGYPRSARLLLVGEATQIVHVPAPPVLTDEPLPAALQPHLRLLDSFLGRRTSGVRSALLSGPSGAGKSHVLAAFLRAHLNRQNNDDDDDDWSPVVDIAPHTRSWRRSLRTAAACGAIVVLDWMETAPRDCRQALAGLLQQGRVRAVGVSNAGGSKLAKLLALFDEHIVFDRLPRLASSLLLRSSPSTPWSMIGGLDGVKLQLQQSVVWKKTHAAGFRRLGIRPPSAVLLYGPPGCGKTLLAKAIATEALASFISIDITDIIKSYVGESEKALASIFAAAAQSSPCVLFIDEIQAVFRSRSADTAGASALISLLLMCMDRLADADVFLLAATNRPQDIDPSFLRAGRFDRLIYVPPPDRHARRTILAQLTAAMPLAADVDLDALAASHTNLFTGSDLYNLCRHAAFAAFKRQPAAAAAAAVAVAMDDFITAAYSSCTPSLSRAMLRDYERLSSVMSRAVVATSSQRTVASSLPSTPDILSADWKPDNIEHPW